MFLLAGALEILMRMTLGIRDCAEGTSGYSNVSPLLLLAGVWEMPGVWLTNQGISFWLFRILQRIYSASACRSSNDTDEYGSLSALTSFGLLAHTLKWRRCLCLQGYQKCWWGWFIELGIIKQVVPHSLRSQRPFCLQEYQRHQRERFLDQRTRRWEKIKHAEVLCAFLLAAMCPVLIRVVFWTMVPQSFTSV